MAKVMSFVMTVFMLVPILAPSIGQLVLFVAAILEGGFRQLVQSTPLRFGIGFGIGALWLAYFCLSGRSIRR